MSNPQLSICIPTFNRCKSLDNTLNILFDYLDSDIEIIISDNASTDDTQRVASKYKHPKVHYYKNKQNHKAIFNVIKVLELSNGIYSVLLSDEDTLYVEEVLKIIKKYDKTNLGLIIGQFKSNTGEKIRKLKNLVLKKNSGNLLYIINNSEYLSGLIFKKSAINFKNCWLEFNKENHGMIGVFPHIYIAIQIIKDSKVITSKITIGFQREIANSFMDELYFLPEYSLRQFINRYQLIEASKISRNLKLNSLIRLYIKYVSIAKEHRNMMLSENIQNYYKYSMPKKIDIEMVNDEYLKNLKFAKKIINDSLSTYRLLKIYYKLSINLKFYYFNYIHKYLIFENYLRYLRRYFFRKVK